MGTHTMDSAHCFGRLAKAKEYAHYKKDANAIDEIINEILAPELPKGVHYHLVNEKDIEVLCDMLPNVRDLKNKALSDNCVLKLLYVFKEKSLGRNWYQVIMIVASAMT